MKYFFLIIGALAAVSISIAIFLRDADEKPLTRNGQQAAAMAIAKSYKEAVQERTEKRDQAEVPTAICEKERYNFGIMDPLTVGNHTFYIENRSAVDLLIEGGASTCKCTLSDLKQAVVPPGAKYPITLTWNSGHAKQSFEQSATVVTNDPTNREISLAVFGKVRAVFASTPTQVNLGRLIPSTESTELFTVYSQIWDDFEIVKVESTQNSISARLAPEGSEQLVASDDELYNAKSTALLEIKYDGEAPQGPLAGQLRLYVKPPKDWDKKKQEFDDENGLGDEHTGDENTLVADSETKNALPDIRFPQQEDGTILAELPFYGTVVRRLSLYGKSIKSDGSVALGTLSPKDSVNQEWTIIGRVRGNLTPTKVTAVATGIPGLVADVETINAEPSKYSFRISLRTTERLKAAIYNGPQAGMLTIEADGMPPGDDRLEFPINLIVVKI